MKRALVVVDMIEDFAHEGGALYCGPSMGRIIPVIQKELGRARSAGEPVIYLTDNHVPDDAEFKVFPRTRSQAHEARRSSPSSPPMTTTM